MSEQVLSSLKRDTEKRSVYTIHAPANSLTLLQFSLGDIIYTEHAVLLFLSLSKLIIVILSLIAYRFKT